MGYTTADILTSVKKRGVIPTSQKTFSDDDFVRFMDEELRLQIVPMLIRLRENYFVDVYDQSVVAGQDTYDLPPRAIGMKVKNVYYVDDQGRPFELARIDIDDIPYLQNSSTETVGEPRYFYFKDNYVILLPVPNNSTGTIRQYYYLRRNELIQTTACGQITASASGDLTLNNVPTSFTTAQVYDIVKGTPGFQTLASDLTASAVTTSDITFSVGDVPSAVAVGDYVCLAQQSPIPQIPYDIFPLLSQRALVRALRGISDTVGADKAEADMKSLQDATEHLLSDRADEQSKKIWSPNNISQYVWGRFARW